MGNLVFLVPASPQTVRALAAVLEADGCVVEELDTTGVATVLSVATDRDSGDIESIVTAIAPESRLTEGLS